MDDDFNTVLNALPQLIKSHLSSVQNNSLPITANVTSIPTLPPLPTTGLGTTKTFEHLQSIILPNLAQGHAGPRYYGTHFPLKPANLLRIRYRWRDSSSVDCRLPRFNL